MLWFATSQGLSKFLPKAAAPMAPPPIFIKGLRLGGEKEAISPLGETDVELQDMQPGNNQLQIDFVGVSFAPGERVVYQYKFDGADQWSVPSEQSTITFASLASGHYRLLVRAIGSDGVTSLAPAIVTFTVLRPIWQRWWFILLTVASLSFVAYWIYRSRVSRLLEVERVRTRIATDLHDDIGANLTTIAILSEVARQQLGNGGPEQDRPLSSIARISREAVASMSDIVWAINPQRDHLPDLLGRMRQHAEESCLPGEIELSFDDGESAVDLQLGVGVRRDLFLIFKEAVSNAVRHSNCNHLWITILLERNQFSLEITDDGEGFETDAKHEGNGLLNLKRRAAKLSGQLIVKSIAHQGTTIKFSFPVRRERLLSLPTKLRR
jgi:two-component sensor histidine kinase